MLKFTTAALVIYSILTISLATPTLAQSKSGPSADAQATNQPETKTSELKKTIDAETAKFKSESARFDPVKTEKEMRKQMTKSNWTKKEKTFWILFAVGMAALVFLLIKYGKECIRSSPPGCTPGVDEFCTCEEYEQNP